MAKLLIDKNVEIEVNEGSEATIRVAGGEVTVQVKEQKPAVTLEGNARVIEWWVESVLRDFEVRNFELRDFDLRDFNPPKDFNPNHFNHKYFDLKENWFQRLLGRFGF